MKVHVTDLKPGDLLQTDTYNELGLHVLQKGTYLQSEEISKLMQHGVNYVDIETAFIAEEADRSFDIHPLQQELLLRTKPHLENAVNGFESLFIEALATGKFNNTVVDDILEPLIDQLKEQKDVVSLMLAFNHEDDYTYNHSMQVSILSYYIATWLGYSKNEPMRQGEQVIYMMLVNV
ncbi:two-component response regulator [Paenibacillus pini JCM 16418]|uniref:Two-component response regulator n=1 Tax=Paenibacillus pini JCM 16418 TaxID=1236976 RepID=W7YFK6_9BACL|nr:two-component response regulator [Paenibacillus pini JCM 16418]